MTSPIIRLAKKSDRPALAKLVAALHRFPPHRARGQWTHGSPREILNALANDPAVRILVAEKSGHLVGYLAGKFDRRPRGRPRRVGHIMETYVIPEFRRTGIACILVIEFLDGLRRQGAEDVKVQYVMGNRVAMSFWNRLGFRPLVTSAHAAPRTIRRALSPPR
jgi:ribosomal protein S18 acetylase RimI-like enzyme